MNLDDLKNIAASRTQGNWPTIPGVGPDEDIGDYVVGAVGPGHRFLPGDHWDFNFTKPTYLLSEDEAQRRAKCDQEFIFLAANVLMSFCALSKRLTT